MLISRNLTLSPRCSDSKTELFVYSLDLSCITHWPTEIELGKKIFDKLQRVLKPIRLTPGKETRPTAQYSPLSARRHEGAP